MSKVLIVGATGFTGANISRELISRGHSVVGLARNPEANTVPGVQMFAGTVTDPANLEAALYGVDTVILATRHSDIHNGAPAADFIVPIAQQVAQHGVRLGVIGGAGSLFAFEGGPRLFETPEFPDAYKGEALAAFDTLVALQNSSDTNWFYLSPAGLYGSFAPGERRGTYREALDTLVVAEDGSSSIGGEDLAIAVVDEIEQGKHHNRRFTIGY